MARRSGARRAATAYRQPRGRVHLAQMLRRSPSEDGTIERETLDGLRDEAAPVLFGARPD
ncbi:MAG: hypothetical protein ACYCZN_04345 [Candidatus Dormibacteria bacterium]